MAKKLTLGRDSQIGGVCSGLAEYFDVDVAVVRILFALSFFLSGSGALIYLILWWALPEHP